MSKDKAELPKKWEKVLKDLPEFRDTADAASKEDLKKMLVTCEGNIFNVEAEREMDEKLIAAKELVKDLSGAYGDALKVQTAKIKYIMFLLDGKGESLGSAEESDED